MIIRSKILRVNFKKYPSAYDVYEGTKKDFDGWLKNQKQIYPIENKESKTD